MSKTVDYYLAPQSPWTYLGHQRLVQIAKATGSKVRVMPMDLGQVFPISGGLPLGKRAPQRQAYRLVEMARFSKALSLPMNLHPKFFPVAGDPAAKLIIAVDMHHGTDAALAITGAVLAAVWHEERDIADAATLAALLSEHKLDAACLALSNTPEVQARYDSYTQSAIDAQVFGAPTYVIDGEMFWGQDRLDFVANALKS
ncbi:2-hydroxychromene-2-carboxylate isomerase [Limnohabitans sp. TEGF004]|uniref:2-hydroxychromene-2-carboxylate isomerase n=1 Tax=Limnohabitans sp. TEGF004 TaxID=2986281 RepID=UPI0023770F6A|nr:2-hydroxychromene-2-carboxylate isomerase [Limnohabitans sp. TEGF004]BDU56133.1 2-hydroxychromene-2-carboxylate isomerase [Limnohabitans sp. TEGF004]